MDNRNERYDRTAAELRRRRKAREARERRKKALFRRRAMIVGGGVLAIALVVGIIVLVANLISSGVKPQVTPSIAATGSSQSQTSTLPAATTATQNRQTSNNTQIVNGNGGSNASNGSNTSNDSNGGYYDSGDANNYYDDNVEDNAAAPYEDNQQYDDSYSQTGNQGSNPGSEDGGSQAQQSGGQLHYYASGKTSYGWDWTYAGGDGLVDVACSYNTSTKQYDFIITGKEPGSGSVTLIYNTDDTTSASQTVSFTVDNDLNVTAG